MSREPEITTDEIITGEEFLAGGGLIAKLIREKDWSLTPLGPIKLWPQSLKTSINICINSPFPIIIWWSSDFLLFYNESYGKLIGSMHPGIFGKKASDSFPEFKEMLEAKLKKIYTTGKPFFADNQLRLLTRNGFIEETYFSTSESPIYNNEGDISGIFVVTNDTTEKVIQERHAETLKRLELEINKADSIVALYKNVISILEDNDRDFPFATIYQVDDKTKTAAFIAKTGKINPFSNDYQVIDLSLETDQSSKFIECVRTNKTVYVSNVRQRVGDLPTGYWRAYPEEGLFLPITHFTKKYPLAVLVTSINPHLKLDNNYKKFFEEIEKEIEKGTDRLFIREQEKREIETSNRDYRQLNNLIVQAPVSIAILQGPQFIVELANENMLELWGNPTLEQVIKKPFFEAVPDLVNRGYEEILGDVCNKGDRYVANESVVTLHRNDKEEQLYVNFVFEPLRDENEYVSGIIAIATDVTSQVKLRKGIEESQEQLKIAIETAELGTYSWELPQTELVFSDRMAQIYGYAGSTNLTQADLQKSVHPDDKLILEKAYEDCKKNGLLEYECRLIWPDKSLHWISVRSKVIFNEEGVPVKLYGTAKEITAQKMFAAKLENEVEKQTKNLEKKNKELKRSEDRYQKITEEVEDYAIILLSTDGTVLNWNKGAEKIKGYSAQQIIGKNIRIFYPEEDQKANLPGKLLAEATKKGRASHEGYRVKKDGTTFWASVIITALHNENNENNEIIGYSKITRDDL